MNIHCHAVLSPCIGLCKLAEDGLCEGCHRSGNEIAAWSGMRDDVRLHYMDVVLPERAAQRDVP